MKKKMLTLAAAGLLAAPLVFAAGKGGGAKHPEMHKAKMAIKNASEALGKAAHDYDGHRAKALDLLKQADAEIQAGLDYAKAHPEEFKGK